MNKMTAVVDKYVTLSNGQKMPSVGLGTSSSTPEDVLEKVLEAAFEAGLRHFDTAYIYRTEQIIGRVLQKLFRSGRARRVDVFITTKLPIFGMHPDRVEYFLHKSLANLQLEYVDLYLVHHPKSVQYDEKTDAAKLDEKGNTIPEPEVDHLAIWSKMEDQVKAGRVRSIGLSNFDIPQIENILLNHVRIKPVVLQIELHLYLQQTEIRKFCRENGISIVAYAPLGSSDFNERLKKRLGSEAKLRDDLPNLLGDPYVNDLAKKYSRTPGQILLRFLLELGVTPIPKTTNPQRVLENIAVYDFSLDEEDMEQLRKMDIGESARVYRH